MRYASRMRCRNRNPMCECNMPLPHDTLPRSPFFPLSAFYLPCPLPFFLSFVPSLLLPPCALSPFVLPPFSPFLLSSLSSLFSLVPPLWVLFLVFICFVLPLLVIFFHHAWSARFFPQAVVSAVCAIFLQPNFSGF